MSRAEWVGRDQVARINEFAENCRELFVREQISQVTARRWSNYVGNQ